MNHLALLFFGTFQATLGEEPLIKFRSAKAQGLLIYLILTKHQAHRREVLAALFWPDETDRIAKQNLRQSLYLLRKLLKEVDGHKEEGETFLLITRATVQFNPTSQHSLDVADFLSALHEGQLESATSFYQGDLLPGFDCDSLPFDDWLRRERERYHIQALDALNTLTTHSLTRANFQAAERFARQQLHLEPWREEAHRQLMQALALQGERSAALAQFETCRTALATELGIGPTSETVTLAQRIRETQVKQPAKTETPGDQGRTLNIPFVGRKQEFESLVNAYWRAANDRFQIITVIGKAGIGKTRLTQHFLTWASAQGADVLSGRTFETSSRLSYQPLTQLLRQRLERENAPEDLLSDLWLSQLTRLLPELRDRYPDLPPPTREENTARDHLYEAITRLFFALAQRQPVVLFIDDWHWADSASLEFLLYAALRWSEKKTAILLLLTLRQEAVDDHPDLQRWLAQLNHSLETGSLQLAELSQDDTAHMVKRLLGPEPGDRGSDLDRFNRWLFDETEGQPLFLAETIKSLVADGFVKPASGSATGYINWESFGEWEQIARSWLLPEVQQLIRNWLKRISPAAVKMLTAGSVLGSNISFEHLCHVAALDQLEGLSALDELLDKQLLLEIEQPASAVLQEPRYTFSHQTVSAMVYAEAGAARRRLLHMRAFEALETSASAAADLAHHAIKGGLLVEAFQQSLLAGNAAAGLLAVRVAIPHYETALEIAEQMGWPDSISLTDRQALHTALGRAYELTEAWPKAHNIYAAMIKHAHTIGSPALECAGLNHLAVVQLHDGNHPQAQATLQQAQSIAEQIGDRQSLAESQVILSSAALRDQRPHIALHHGEKALALTRELGDPRLLARSIRSVSVAYSFLRQWHKALPYIIETHQLHAAAGDEVLAAGSQHGIGFLQLLTGHPVQSLATLQESFAFSQRIENLNMQVDCAWIMARTYLELGNYGAAIRMGRFALEQAPVVATPLMSLYVRYTWGIIQRTLMNLETAQQIMLGIFEQSSGQEGIGWSDQAPELCALYASMGDWEKAHRYAQQIIHTHKDEPLPPFNLTGWFEVEALLRNNEGELAQSIVKMRAEIVGNNRRYQLVILRSWAVLAKWDGETAQAISHLEAALALARDLDLPGEVWPILAELGELQEEQGKAQDAYREAAVIINRLADTIDAEDLRVGFLTAGPVQSILEEAI